MKANHVMLMILGVFMLGNGFAQTLIPNKNPQSKFDVNYTTEQQPAQYIGGVEAMVKFVSENIVLPEEKEETRSNITLSLTIDNQGKVVESGVLIGINPTVDKAVLKVVDKMPKWQPARVNGEAVFSEQIITLEIIH